jgi:hypothetical protein
MKQFFVPALLLAFVGAAAAIAAGSAQSPAPVAADPAPDRCPVFGGTSGACPFSAAGHGAADAECTKGAAEECPMSADCQECEKRCEDPQAPECCQKKLACDKCKKHEEPAQKP